MKPTRTLSDLPFLILQFAIFSWNTKDFHSSPWNNIHLCNALNIVQIALKVLHMLISSTIQKNSKRHIFKSTHFAIHTFCIHFKSPTHDECEHASQTDSNWIHFLEENCAKSLKVNMTTLLHQKYPVIYHQCCAVVSWYTLYIYIYSLPLLFVSNSYLKSLH